MEFWCTDGNVVSADSVRACLSKDWNFLIALNGENVTGLSNMQDFSMASVGM
jgi:hypothetical protein